MRLRKYLNEQIKFNDELVGTQSGQSDLRLTATINGDIVGWIDYTDFQGEISVKMIEVKSAYRSKGIGKKLVLELQKMYPKKEIDFGLLTGAGARLLKSLKSKLYVDKAIIKKRKQLKQEYKNLEKEEKDLAKKLEGLNQPIDKNEIEKIGKRLNDISYRMYDIEQESYELR